MERKDVLHRKLSALALIATLSGCGTVLNLRATNVPAPPPGEISIWAEGHHPPPKLVYGGVRVDASAGPGWFVEASGTPPLALVGAYTCLIDLPVCVVTDTLTLPITIPAAIERRKVERGPQGESNLHPVSINCGDRGPPDRAPRIVSPSAQ